MYQREKDTLLTVNVSFTVQATEYNYGKNGSKGSCSSSSFW